MVPAVPSATSHGMIPEYRICPICMAHCMSVRTLAHAHQAKQETCLQHLCFTFVSLLALTLNSADWHDSNMPLCTTARLRMGMSALEKDSMHSQLTPVLATCPA